MIGNTLMELPATERNALDYMRQWIMERTGLHFPENKQTNLFHRLQKVCYQSGIQDLEELTCLIKERQNPGLETRIIQTACTNHTYFFREPEILHFFTHRIVPELPANETWRIWSAATSSGDEAYTIAILLAECLGVNKAQRQATILGTDLSDKMLQQAEKGVYTKNNLRYIEDNEVLQRYFKCVNKDHWQVIPAISEMCMFRRLNLKNPEWPFRKRFHVIFCRNIFYYFNKQQQEEILNRLYEFTVPGGWLLTSVTETLLGVVSPWKKVSNGVWRKIIS